MRTTGVVRVEVFSAVMLAANDAQEEMRDPAFWDDARMWCLLHQMPWLQLNGSMACEKPYLKHLGEHSPGTEGEDSIKAVRTLHDHVKAIRPEGVRGELAQSSRNYTTALCVHRGLLTAEGARLLAFGTVTSDLSQSVASLQDQVLKHMQAFDDGGDFFAFTAWVKSPACWQELTA